VRTGQADGYDRVQSDRWGSGVGIADSGIGFGRHGDEVRGSAISIFIVGRSVMAAARGAARGVPIGDADD
jgi:hypothetical protein